MQVGRQKCVQLKKLTLTSKNNIQTVYTLTSESACYENRSSTLSSQVCSIVPFRFCCKLFKICHGLYLRSSHFLSQENEKKTFSTSSLIRNAYLRSSHLFSQENEKNVFNIITYEMLRKNCCF